MPVDNGKYSDLLHEAESSLRS